MKIDNLEADELFHLGVQASQEGDFDKAAAFFKRAGRISPGVDTSYMLGVAYAGAGMKELAVCEMQDAIAQDAEAWHIYLHIAVIKLQLQHDDAKDFLYPIAKLPADNYLGESARGIMAMIDFELAIAKQFLTNAIALNTVNEPLNQNLNNMLAQVEAKLLLTDAADNGIKHWCSMRLALVDKQLSNEHPWKAIGIVNLLVFIE